MAIKKKGAREKMPSILRGGLDSWEDLTSNLYDVDFWRPFGSLWEDFSQPLNKYINVWHPRIDVKETDKEVIVKADLPNVDPQKINIELDKGQLMISGHAEEEKEEKGERWYRCERQYGEFRRAMSIPTDLDIEKASAETKNGLLTIRLPKKEGSERKTIPIKNIT